MRERPKPSRLAAHVSLSGHRLSVRAAAAGRRRCAAMSAVSLRLSRQGGECEAEHRDDEDDRHEEEDEPALDHALLPLAGPLR